jgi:hypothetical protein
VLVAMLGTWDAGPGGAFELPGGAQWTDNIHNGGFVTPDTTGGIIPHPSPPATYVNMYNLTPDTPARYQADGSPGRDFNSQRFFAGWGIQPAALDGIPVFALGTTDLTPGSSLYYNDDDWLWEEYPGYGFDNTLLATFWVTKDTTLNPGQILFTGLGAMCSPEGGSAYSGFNLTVQIVPEPSTVALLGCGLFGLLANAWRKRK